jgi:hypothetical protein
LPVVLSEARQGSTVRQLLVVELTDWRTTAGAAPIHTEERP